MKFSDYDLCLITNEKQRMYFLGFHSSAGYLMFNKAQRIFVVDKRYFSAAQKILEPRGFIVICGSDFSHLVNTCENMNVKTLGIDFSSTTITQFKKIKELLPNIYFKDISAELQEDISIKVTPEIAAIQKACKIAEKSFKQVLSSLKEGVTEKEIAAELEYLFKKYGASDKSFDSIVAFGPNSAVPHHETGKTKLHKNMPVLMDFGCVFEGYCSDMTRTVWYGDEPEKDFLDAYNAVYEAHMHAFDNIVAGMNGAEADALARDVLTQKGYGELFTHSLGHGIGVEIHEYPWLAPKRDCVLLNGMVFSNEPGVYFDGKYGIRIEDTVCLQNDSLVTFMQDDKKLIIVNDGKIKKYKS